MRQNLPGWQDISRPIHPGMELYPDDPEVRFVPHARVEEAGFAVTALSLGSHTGTHVDAPSHLLTGGATIDRLPLDRLQGPALVSRPTCSVLDAAALTKLRLPPVPRLLFRTRPHGPAHLTVDGASRLVDQGVQLLGWDRLSVEAEEAVDLPAHRVLLSAGVVLVEGLDLEGVESGEHEVIVLPLRLLGLDGSPARALLRPVVPGA